jgi:large subunit ribosomal protein L13
MIPRGPLGRQQLSNCKIYNDTNHKHQAQNPSILDISKLNSKNTISRRN